MITTPAQKIFFKPSHWFTVVQQRIASKLTWWRSLSLFFLANFSVTFVTISIWRSLWRSASLIYQSASTMFLSALFWNLWMLSVLLCFLHPHSCMPKVHTGFNICLYSISLLCIDRADLLPMSQHIFFYFSPSSSRFFLTCAFQRSLASSVMPRYFAVLEWGMTLPFRVIGIWWHSTHEWKEFFTSKCCNIKCEYSLEARAQTCNM